jgi:hypothetical protein
MRFRFRLTGVPALVFPVAALLAGCSSGTSQVSTANLAPVRDEPRYSDNRMGQPYSLPRRDADRSYAQRQYTDPGRPTPREYAAYDNGYRTQTIQTGSLGASNNAYSPDGRWQQPAHGVRPAAGAHREPYAPHVVEVREGDTLYGLSRRYNVPVGDLVAANRLPNERIAIGQRLVIPTRYR